MKAYLRFSFILIEPFGLQDENKPGISTYPRMFIYTPYPKHTHTIESIIKYNKKDNL